MTNDQLLEKLYEGSLTPDERSLLDTRVAESPEFAAEVHEFMTVVQLLDQEKQEDRADTAFLESTRSKVVTLIAAAGAAGAGGAAVQSGGLSTIAGNAAQWIIAALGAAGIGGVVLWNVLSDTPDTRSVRQEQPSASAPAVPGVQVPEQEVVSTPPVADNAGVQPEPIAETPVQRPDPPAHTPPVSPPASTSSVDPKTTKKEEGEGGDNEDGARGVMDKQAEATYQNELTHFMKRLEEAKIQKDMKKQADVLLNIANIEYLLGRHGSALSHAEQSLDIWKQVGDPTGRASAYRHIGMINREDSKLSAAASALMRGISLVEGEGHEELRGQMLGELAKVYEQQGNKQLAFEKMYACVVLLRRTGSPTLGEWESELKRLEAMMK